MTTSPPPAALPPRTLLRGWQILIIENDAASLYLLEEILYHFGATVHTATNGLEALRMLDYLRPHLLISDLSMSVMSGWELIERLRRDQRWLTLPIIALTAHATPGYHDRTCAAGFNGYLTKPILIDKFIAELMQIINGLPRPPHTSQPAS